MAVWHRFLAARKPPQACRFETPTWSAEPVRVSPSFPELPREPAELLRACPSCLVPACQGAHRLLGRLTVEVVEGARQVREAGAEAICLWVREAVEAVEAVRAVQAVEEEEVVVEQAERKQPHHPQAGEAGFRPGA